MSKLATQMVDAAERALAAIEKGADAAVTTSGWVRALASSEGREGGEYHRALGLREEPGWGSVAREAFSSLYGGATPVAPEEAPEGSGWMREALAQAQSLPEWHALQARSQSDEWATGIAASAALEVLAQRLPALPQTDAAEAAEELRYLGELAKEQGRASSGHLRRTAGAKKRLEQALEQAAAAEQGVRAAAASLRSGLRGAAQKASAEIDEAEAALGGLGCGSQSGMRARIAAPRSHVLSSLRGNSKLQRVAKLAGRLKSQAVRKQAEKSANVRTELSEVVTGNDVARVLPSEWSLLADEDTEILLYAKLAEAKALQYLIVGKEQKIEGPIVLAIDESGSMQGLPDEWAKAIALTLVEIAARQRRSFVLLHFDSAVTHEQRFDDPRSLSFDAVMDLVTHFSGGGTCIREPMRRATEIIAKAQLERTSLAKADMVLITDGNDEKDYLDQLALLKKLGASTFAFIIDGDSQATFGEFDHVVQIETKRDIGGASDKLNGVFSI